MTKKNTLSRELVELKIKWWSIVEGRQYTDMTKEQLHKIIWKQSNKSIANDIECYKARFENAKIIIG